jgi:hypothetical protein
VSPDQPEQYQTTDGEASESIERLSPTQVQDLGALEELRSRFLDFFAAEQAALTETPLGC